MKSTKIYSLFFLFVCLFAYLFTMPLQAQDVKDNFTEADKTFFDAQKAPIQKWLADIGLDDSKIKEVEILTITDFNPNFVVLRLKVEQADTWLSIREAYLLANKREIEKDIFDKFVYFCEANPKQVQIVIKDTKSYKVRAGINDEGREIEIKEDNKPKSPSIERFNLPKFRVIPDNIAMVYDEFAPARQKIIAVLQKHYQGRENVQFKVFDFDNKIHIRVSNLKKEIIYDKMFGDFEQIFINVDLLKTGRYVTFVCSVDGKHSTNFFTAPRTLTGYKDMGNNGYQVYIDEYAQKITTYLYKNIK
jgi:hypothetical protein